MADYIVFDSDDFGCNHIISDQTQSRDCRKELDGLHYANPNFKATLFTIPAEMTYELLEWCRANSGWIQLAVHGIYHTSNYECSEMTEEEFDKALKPFEYMIDTYFVKGFKAPGWQISDGIYQWLLKNGFWVADQHYNDERRPEGLQVYHVGESSIHTHTWSCEGNGIDETYPDLEAKIKSAQEFRFISEVV